MPSEGPIAFQWPSIGVREVIVFPALVSEIKITCGHWSNSLILPRLNALVR